MPSKRQPLSLQISNWTRTTIVSVTQRQERVPALYRPKFPKLRKQNRSHSFPGTLILLNLQLSASIPARLILLLFVFTAPALVTAPDPLGKRQLSLVAI